MFIHCDVSRSVTSHPACYEGSLKLHSILEGDMVCLLDFQQMTQIVQQQLLFSDTRAAQTVILLLTFQSRHGRGQLAYILVPFRVNELGLTNFASSMSQIEVFILI